VAELTLKTPIWRYMDLGRFLALIRGKENGNNRTRDGLLYFATRSELPDPSELIRPLDDPALKRLQSLDPPGLDIDHPDSATQSLRRRDNDQVRISCWHENSDESVAMWRLYVSGNEGIAIKTDVGTLGRLISRDDRHAFIGRIQYRGQPRQEAQLLKFDLGWCLGPETVPAYEQNVFLKNSCYRHEQEVRAIIYRARYYEHADYESTMEAPQKTTGEFVGVDLSQLIQRIVVSPGFPSWAIGALQDIVTEAGVADSGGIPIVVEPSHVHDTPGNDVFRS
jgi:hypothetical protein